MFFPGFFFQAEDGIRDLVRSRGLGDVYKRQAKLTKASQCIEAKLQASADYTAAATRVKLTAAKCCLLYTSDAADERSSVDLGGRRIIKKKKGERNRHAQHITRKNNIVIHRSTIVEKTDE